MIILWIALGSALGGVLRYLLGTAVQTGLGEPAFPWGTWLVNVLGCAAIGLLTPVLAKGGTGSALLIVGVLGGFTTFSAFSMQTVELAAAGRWDLAIGYAAASLTACLFATTAGLWCGRWLAGPGAGLA